VNSGMRARRPAQADRSSLSTEAGRKVPRRGRKPPAEGGTLPPQGACRLADCVDVPRVAVIGIGEDGLAGLRAEARAAVEAADVLVGGERHHRLVAEHPAERVIFRCDAEALAQRVAELAQTGRRVVVLASGDPLFFGIGPALSARLGRDQIEVHPNLGSVQVAFARLREAWHDAAVLSAHGRPLQPVVDQALSQPKLAILLDNVQTGQVVAEALLAAGMEPEAEAWLMQRLGGPAERVQRGRLADVPAWTSDPLSLLVILREPEHVRGPEPRLGLPDDSYQHLKGQITKAEVRAVSLARLAPRRGDTVWDVGAGSGAVSIEAAWLCHPGKVYAVERRPEQRVCAATNIGRFAAHNVHVVEGEAPQALHDLPDPDAVFVGGSGGHLGSILDCAAHRLRGGGRLVGNFATLEALHEATTCLDALGLTWDMAELSVARATPISRGRTRLAALNPVFVVSARVG
jgi:precorrin-6B C5,15-methyltransferase / cobalt-precorrin-6B C5,C15-methyltransferase